MSEYIDRLAGLIYNPDPNGQDGYDWDEAQNRIRAILTAMRIPSEAMVDAARKNSGAYRHQLEEGWTDMIDQALAE